MSWQLVDRTPHLMLSVVPHVFEIMEIETKQKKGNSPGRSRIPIYLIAVAAVPRAGQQKVIPR